MFGNALGSSLAAGLTPPRSSIATGSAAVTGRQIDVSDFGPLVMPEENHSALESALEIDEFDRRLDARVNASVRAAAIDRDFGLRDKLIRITANIPAFEVASSKQTGVNAAWDPSNPLGLSGYGVPRTPADVAALLQREFFSVKSNASIIADLSQRATQGPSVSALDPAVEAAAEYQRLATRNGIANSLLLGTPAGFPGAVSRLSGQNENKVAAAIEIGAAILEGEMAGSGIPGRGAIYVGPRAGFESVSTSTQFGVNSTSRAFKTGEDVIHFEKHGSEIAQTLGYENYSINQYVQDANSVIANGTFAPELNAYVSIPGGTGSAKGLMVGLDRATGEITTMHMKPVSWFETKAPREALNNR